MSQRDEDLTRLEESLGYRFDRLELLETALTHRSFANERGVGAHFERLEFLGDAVLGLIASEWLFEEHPELPEGDLSKRRSFLVSRDNLATFAVQLEIGPALRLGVGEDRSGGRHRPSLLADAMEAVLAAVYLDGGLEVTRSVLYPMIRAAAKELERERFQDAKTAFQEMAQARGSLLPEYRHVSQEGPDHRRWFVVECWLDDRRMGRGEGQTKKEAEQRAARAALVRAAAG